MYPLIHVSVKISLLIGRFQLAVSIPAIFPVHVFGFTDTVAWSDPVSQSFTNLP